MDETVRTILQHKRERIMFWIVNIPMKYQKHTAGQFFGDNKEEYNVML